MASISSEPDYNHMLYGGVWKHVVFDPPDNLPDIVQASKHAISFIQKRYPSTVADKVAVTCLTKIELWCSLSDQGPLTVTEHVTTKNGDEFPVSVPLSFGSTYNFQLIFTMDDSTQAVHHITITKTSQMEQFYIYAHAFHTVTSSFCQQRLGLSTSICSGCLKGLPILSNLAANKLLELTPDQMCQISEDQHNSHPTLRQSQNVHEPKESLTDLAANNLEHTVSNKDKNSEKMHKLGLSIMTYNIWNFHTYEYNGRYHQRINRISEVLKEAGPDIVAFQEVRLETPLGGRLGPCQMDHLMSLMPQYQFVYQPAQLQRNSLDQGRTEEGVAIFSKYPIIQHDYLLLFRNQSNSADLNQRICLHAVILVPSFGKVHIFNTHLSLSHEAREATVTQILQYMSYYDGELVIFLGDLNASPTETAIRMLTNGSGLLDTWEHLYPSSDGFTFSCLEDSLSKRIDYIFMRKTETVSVQKVEVLDDRKRSDAASDHRAVTATFVHTDSDAT
ncbi:hypothetical protein BsWGS_04493 [Bradybaena similaris]